MKTRTYRMIIFLLLTVNLSIGINCSNLAVLTPLEQNNFRNYSSYESLARYLEEVQELSNEIKVESIGNSVEKRDIYLVSFKKDNQNPEKRIKVLIYCQQHGNEVSGKEASLALIRDLTLGKYSYFFDRLEILIIPCINPDGSEKNLRRNLNKVDLNRNHVIKSEPEVEALHSIFQKYLPEVTLDIHEYSGYSEKWANTGFLKAMDTQLGGPTNLNVSEKIRTYVSEKVIPYVDEHVSGRGFYFHRYLVGGPPEENRVRYSTTSINDGRSSMGIYNTLSFILEGRKSRYPLQTIKKLYRAQLETIIGFLEFMYNNHSEIMELVRVERKSLSEKKPGDKLVLRMEYVKKKDDPDLTIPVYHLPEMFPVRKKYTNFSPTVEAVYFTGFPSGYLIRPGHEEIRSLLQKHKIEFSELQTVEEFSCEIFEIDSVKKVREEDKSMLDLKISAKKQTRSFPAGTIVIPINQLRSNLIGIMLEPRSMWGLVQYKKFTYPLTREQEYPIARYFVK